MQTIYDAKILIVDDNQDLLNLVTTALRSTGYNQLTACTGCAAAQAAFAANRPDLMILDINLPDGTAQPLTATERALLQKLAENRGHIVTYDAVCEAVWGADYYGYENSLNVHIRHLREKLEPNPSKPQYLLTVRGIGYKLAEENAHNENFCSPDPPLCAGHSRYCAAGGRFAGGADFLCGVQVQCGGCNRLPGRRLG